MCVCVCVCVCVCLQVWCGVDGMWVWVNAAVTYQSHDSQTFNLMTHLQVVVAWRVVYA